MNTKQSTASTLTDEQILEIGVDHEAYSQSDRVIRFSPAQFVKCARTLLSAQSQVEDAKRYQAIRKMLTSTEEENERFVELMSEYFGDDEIGKPTPEQFDGAIDSAIAAQERKK